MAYNRGYALLRQTARSGATRILLAYLEFYNAGSVKLNRASGKRIYVHAAALSIFGTCQPGVFVKAIGADGKAHNQVENGLAARFILAAPPTKAKRWRVVVPFDGGEYHAMVGQLLAIPLLRDGEGRVEPAVVDLSDAAAGCFAKFVNEHGAETAAIVNPALRYHFAKLEAVAARLALILHLCEVASEDHQESVVGERHVLGGIALARWYGREAARVYDHFESAADLERRELLDQIDAHGGFITPREMRRVRRRWADSAVAEMALRKLAREGYGKIVITTPGPQGGRPSLRFQLYDTPKPAQTCESPDSAEVPSTGTPESEPSRETTQPHTEVRDE